MLIRRHGSLRELIRRQHGEFMRYQQRRDAELRQRDEESRRRAEERDREFRRRDEEFRKLAEETREFNRELLLRNEKVYKALIAEVEEGRKQIQADIKSVLDALDRLEGSGGAAAA
jgi:hypothetical protein